MICINTNFTSVVSLGVLFKHNYITSYILTVTDQTKEQANKLYRPTIRLLPSQK